MLIDDEVSTQAALERVREANRAARALIEREGATLLEALRQAVGGGPSRFRLMPISAPATPPHYLAMLRGAQTVDGFRLDHLAAEWKLTPREKDVLAAMITGKANKEVADSLGLAIKSIEMLVTRLMRKAGTSGRAQLVSVFWSGDGQR